MNILEVKDLCKTYIVNKQSNNVLQNVNLTVDEGEFVSVMGPSGSGKSTLLYTVSGMDTVTAGSVFFDGEEIIWNYDCSKAIGKQIPSSELFAPANEERCVNYLGAFLYPPWGAVYSEKDLDCVNSALFPNGTGHLEVYKWSTDWSEYFDDGREWWGTLCLTVYDKSLDRFAVILASATD